VVVGDFKVACRISPGEADAILAVDTDAVLTQAVACEGFELIAAWNTEFVEIRHGA
jgi:hypothetical protein